jgi:hypothetical protein
MATYLLHPGRLQWKADQLRDVARTLHGYWHRKEMEEMAEVYERIANAILSNEEIDVVERFLRRNDARRQ